LVYTSHFFFIVLLLYQIFYEKSSGGTYDPDKIIGLIFIKKYVIIKWEAKFADRDF
jgi:hypothetical protein